MSNDILILGAGESGVGAAKLALTLGRTPFVSDSGESNSAFLAELDSVGIKYEVGGHNPGVWPSAKEGLTVVKSPGIPDTASVVEELRAEGAEIISEIEFASRNYSGKVVAITGANGKTTTTKLIYKMLADAGLNVRCVGNIGVSWARALSECNEEPEVVVEEIKEVAQPVVLVETETSVVKGQEVEEKKEEVEWLLPAKIKVEK